MEFVQCHKMCLPDLQSLLVLSGGPVTPSSIREYNGLRGENRHRGPFKGQQASASNPVQCMCPLDPIDVENQDYVTIRTEFLMSIEEWIETEWLEGDTLDNPENYRGTRPVVEILIFHQEKNKQLLGINLFMCAIFEFFRYHMHWRYNETRKVLSGLFFKAGVHDWHVLGSWLSVLFAEWRHGEGWRVLSGPVVYFCSDWYWL